MDHVHANFPVQIVHKVSFRVEVPLWHKLKNGIADPALDQTAPRRSPARETPVDKGACVRSSGNEETTEEESYVPATGQGCFSSGSGNTPILRAYCAKASI